MKLNVMHFNFKYTIVCGFLTNWQIISKNRIKLIIKCAIVADKYILLRWHALLFDPIVQLDCTCERRFICNYLKYRQQFIYLIIIINH